MLISHYINHRIARVLDLLIRAFGHAVPVFSGSYVFYTPGRTWRMDAWNDGRTTTFQFGGYELLLDRPASVKRSATSESV